MDHWEFNVLNVYNYTKSGKLDGLFRHLQSNLHLEGDICEAGVYKGHTLLGIAHYLKVMGSDKTVYGFDSFKGLPQKGKYDSAEIFHDWYKEGKITDKHYQDVKKLQKYRQGRTLSLSGNFQDASVHDIERRARILELDNIKLIQGPFSETMKGKYKFMVGNVDCDLYESCKTAIKFMWDRMVPGGYLHLDEYYSLKFPGARMAADEWVEAKMHPRKIGEFERWYAVKE